MQTPIEQPGRSRIGDGGRDVPAGRAFGVYVHVPFCARRCDYCAFATWTDRTQLAGAYVEACRREIAAADLPPATSVFFGGGTPSLLPAASLLAILDRVRRVPTAEVTVECNPDTVTPDKLHAYRAGGVNRVSFGAQSMVPHVLEGLGRTHDAGSVERAARWARAAGFETWSLDLIFGGAGERDRDWQATLAAVGVLEPPHVSAYALTVEPGTPLASSPERHPDDDVLAARYLMADTAFGERGLVNYEISNWSLPGHECRHNVSCWEQGDYRGIGCAAHSHRGGRRWWNVRTPERYIAAVDAGISVVAGEAFLDDEGRRLEGLVLALRTRAGVPSLALSDDNRVLLAGRGLVEAGGRGLVLTVTGRLLADEVASRLR